MSSKRGEPGAKRSLLETANIRINWDRAYNNRLKIRVIVSCRLLFQSISPLPSGFCRKKLSWCSHRLRKNEGPVSTVFNSPFWIYSSGGPVCLRYLLRSPCDFVAVTALPFPLLEPVFQVCHAPLHEVR